MPLRGGEGTLAFEQLRNSSRLWSSSLRRAIFASALPISASRSANKEPSAALTWSNRFVTSTPRARSTEKARRASSTSLSALRRKVASAVASACHCDATSSNSAMRESSYIGNPTPRPFAFAGWSSRRLLSCLKLSHASWKPFASLLVTPASFATKLLKRRRNVVSRRCASHDRARCNAPSSSSSSCWKPVRWAESSSSRCRTTSSLRVLDAVVAEASLQRNSKCRSWS
mmetsp:Transcript_53637/g.115324  ORF Transcript_53637/g.115324 Transcript_53637/m.115324 type:complete len:229 (+) Transcript_53637:198-884(+)